MLKRFEKVTGSYIETIAGQKRFAFSHSDTADFYDLPERLQSVSNTHLTLPTILLV